MIHFSDTFPEVEIPPGEIDTSFPINDRHFHRQPVLHLWRSAYDRIDILDNIGCEFAGTLISYRRHIGERVRPFSIAIVDQSVGRMLDQDDYPSFLLEEDTFGVDIEDTTSSFELNGCAY